MVNKKTILALGAAFVLGAISLNALAGSQLRIDDSRGMAVEGSPQPAVTYAYGDPPGSQDPGFIADVSLDGFLLCNYFGNPGQSSYEGIYLRPRHGAWVFGASFAAPPGVTGSVAGLRSVSYNNGQLNLSSCVADGTSPGCGGASLQCFVAGGEGMGTADSRNFFADGFDALTSLQGSSVAITVTHWPVSTDDTFDYTVNVTLPAGALKSQATQSLPESAYVLKQGYDYAVFNDCTILAGGQVITSTTTLNVQCSMRAGASVPTDIPVVVAALFTNAQTIEDDYSDNVAFGYPLVTPQ